MITESLESAAAARWSTSGLPSAEPNEENFAAWRDHLLPAMEELRWEGTPWRASFGTAVEEARRSGKPILLWAMNGHPLACT